MESLNTLSAYRQAILQAANSRELELLIYRALPFVYADMGLPYSGDEFVGVSANLQRRDDSWELWFNIESPKALAALKHLDPVIFTRMSGGSDQASAIVKGNYAAGFSKETKGFDVEPVFDAQQQRLAARLNAATCTQAWLNAFYDELPWSLACARGWTEPTLKQWSTAEQQVERFVDAYPDLFKQSLIFNGRVFGHDRSLVEVNALWSSAANNFTNRIDRTYYPLFNHMPFVDLYRSSVHAFNVSKMDVQVLTQGLQERSKGIVWAYCSIMGSKLMPAYSLMAALQNEAIACSDDLAPSGLFASPTSF